MRTATLIALALAATGCTRRAHLRADFGASSHAYFDRQAQAAADGRLQGLDPEEAALIHQGYREALGTRGAAPRNDPRSSVLIVEDGRAAPPRK